MATRLKRKASPLGEPTSPAASAAEAQPLPLQPSTRMAARVVVALILLGAAIWTALDFLPALIWAVMLGVAMWPLYEKTAHRFSQGPSTLSALVFTLLVTAIIFFPIALATYQIAQQSDLLSDFIARAQHDGIAVPDWIAHLPLAADSVEHWWHDNLSNPESAAAWLQSMNADSAGNFIKTVGGQLMRRLFLLFVSMITLFFLLRGGEGITRRLLMTADRILGDPGEDLILKIALAIRGTISGAILIATAEGLLIGVGYLVASVPNPLLFIILTAAFAMVPFGSWVVFSVAAITLIVSGSSALMAAGVFVWGALVMFSCDHFVWPRLVGNAARLPFLFAFVGLFGGIASFGLVGLFLGPVIMAALLTVWREWVIRVDQRRPVPAHS